MPGPSALALLVLSFSVLQSEDEVDGYRQQVASQQ